MRLEEQDIQEFVKIYEKEFGERLANAEARFMATKLINLMELITKPSGEGRQLEKTHQLRINNVDNG